LAYAAGLSGLPLTIAVIAAAMPTGANAFLLSRRAAGFVQASASAVVVTTVLSVATLSSLLLWMH
jgi:malonate transporter and related proteins